MVMVLPPVQHQGAPVPGRCLYVVPAVHRAYLPLLLVPPRYRGVRRVSCRVRFQHGPLPGVPDVRLSRPAAAVRVPRLRGRRMGVVA